MRYAWGRARGACDICGCDLLPGKGHCRACREDPVASLKAALAEARAEVRTARAALTAAAPAIIRRRPEWRQATPKTQLHALLGSIEGDLLNLNEDIGQRERTLPRVLDHIQQMKEIAAGIADGCWAPAERA